MSIRRQRTWPTLSLGVRNQRGRVEGLDGSDPSAGIFGSDRAREMLRDLRAGTDSVDFICVGDSNGVFNGGYALGLTDALRQLGIVMYATPLFPSGAATADWANTTVNGAGCYIQYRPPGGEVDIGTIRSLYEQSTAGGGSDAEADLIADWGILAGVATVEPFGEDYYDGGFVPDGDSFAGDSTRFLRLNAALVSSGPNRTFMQVSTDYSYRVVYGTFGAGSGAFRTRATNNGIGTIATSASTATNAAVGHSVLALAFTSPSNPAHTVNCHWSTVSITGPFASLLESVTLASGKGFAVSSYNSNGGATTQEIGTRMLLAEPVPTDAPDSQLRMFLAELRARQIAAGGSGRVILWVNSGVNGGGDTVAEWTAGATDAINAVRNAWIALGYPLDDFACMISLTQPMSDSGNLAAEANLVVTRAYARNTWPGDLLQAANVTVVDLSLFRTAGERHAQGCADNLGDEHQEQLGYYLDSLDALTRSMEQIPVPSITEPYAVEFVGGGGGGGGASGGGGAGGYVADSDYLVSPLTAYTVTIGAGGAAVTTPNLKGNPGSSSAFDSLVFAGGGAGSAGALGASEETNVNTRGGSGGGGGYSTGVAMLAGGAITGQGNAGGVKGVTVSPYTSGGGGGAGAAGSNGTATTGGAGGVGTASSITGSSVTRCGGGGGAAYTTSDSGAGGAGGSGGGGAGAAGNATATSATANTGGGGGGSGNAGTSGAGGSGFFIIRYLSPTQRATGGNTIAQVGNYWVHTFTSSGTFTA